MLLIVNFLHVFPPLWVRIKRFMRSGDVVSILSMMALPYLLFIGLNTEHIMT